MKKYMKYCPSYYRKNHLRLNIRQLDGTSSFKQKFTGDEKQFGSLDIDQPEFSDNLMDKVISWLQQENPNPDEFPTEPEKNLKDQEVSESHQSTPVNLEQEGSSADSEFNYDQTYHSGFNEVGFNFSGENKSPSLLYSLSSPFAHQVSNQQQFPEWTTQYPAPLVNQGIYSNVQGFLAQTDVYQYSNIALDASFQGQRILETNSFNQQPILQSPTFGEQYLSNVDLTSLATKASTDQNEDGHSEDQVDFTRYVIDSAPLNNQRCFDTNPTQCVDNPPQLAMNQDDPMDLSSPQIEAKSSLTQQEIFNMIQSHFDQYEAEEDNSFGANPSLELTNPSVPLDHFAVNNAFHNPHVNYGDQNMIDYAAFGYVNNNVQQSNYCNSASQGSFNFLQSPQTMDSQRTSTISSSFGDPGNLNSLQPPCMMPVDSLNSQTSPNNTGAPNGSSLIELLLVDPQEIHKFNNQQRHQRKSIIPQEFMNSTLLGHKEPTQEDLINQKLKELKARGNVDEMIDFVFDEAQKYAQSNPTRRGRRPKNKSANRLNPYEHHQRDLTKVQNSSDSNNSGSIPMFGFDSRQIKGSSNDVISFNRSRDANKPIERTGKRKCIDLDYEDERMAKYTRHQL
ncbi:uncharacterized protein [Clytia hemisphaerica]|uniref:uncharacterized protein n=1 Tax=Clytia hemisphaerica TaxID=252671 RepID=UPI0034D68439